MKGPADWFTGDGGQTLYVTEGEGRVQSRGEQILPIRQGDVVHTPSGGGTGTEQRRSIS